MREVGKTLPLNDKQHRISLTISYRVFFRLHEDLAVEKNYSKLVGLNAKTNFNDY